MRSTVFNLLLILVTCTTAIAGNAGSKDSTKSYLWGLIKISPKTKISYEKGYWFDNFFHRREFHAPVRLVPLEIRYGLGFNGGGGKSGEETLSDWIKYEQQVTAFDGGDLMARLGHQLDLDLMKTNLSYYIFKTSWIDIHTGLNFRYSTLFLPEKIPASDWGTVQTSWNVASTTFSPRLLELSVSNSVNLQWFESWFINLRYTYGLASAKFYATNEIFTDQPSGWGPSVSYAAGLRYILDPGMANQFALGLEVKHVYTKIDRITDPDDLTPIRRFDLSNYGIFLTLSVFYGGKKTSGDSGKEFFFRKDYVTAKAKLEEFTIKYPNHSKRYRAEQLIAECKRKIPIQLMNEGIGFDKRKKTDRALDRYLRARALAEDTTLISGLSDRIEQIADLRLYQAEELLAQGQADRALEIVTRTASYSGKARQSLPRFEAYARMEEGREAMQNGFLFKAIALIDQATEIDPDLNTEAGILRYQVATYLVAQANEVKDVDAIQLAIQSLEKAHELTGGLGQKNERILEQLKSRLQAYEDRKTQRLVNERMDRERAAIRAAKTPGLEVGLTIPQVQDIIGEPHEKIHKMAYKGADVQLWLYRLEDGSTLQLSFRDFILFKIEKE